MMVLLPIRLFSKGPGKGKGLRMRTCPPCEKSDGNSLDATIKKIKPMYSQIKTETISNDALDSFARVHANPPNDAKS